MVTQISQDPVKVEGLRCFGDQNVLEDGFVGKKRFRNKKEGAQVDLMCWERFADGRVGTKHKNRHRPCVFLDQQVR